ncbi:MAG TPA: redoxin domain-containing protein [Chitinophagales bacterium]|jgi:peroxiredoxin|nr:redoxin domain-containing protein [Chitinophagales bacterium]HQG37625.1 redoxin domain-containing protein [Chitinophagales bacterium]
MKKFFTFTLLFIFTLITFSQENNFDIKITVKGMENQMGILAYYYGDKRYVKDTLNFDAKGLATIKGKKNIAKGVYLIAFPSMRYSTFDIILNEPNFSINTDTLHFIKHASVKNSLENKEMFDDMKYMLPLGVQTDSLQKLLKKTEKDTKEYEGIIKSLDAISKQILTHRKELIKNNPTTFYSKLLKAMLDIDVPEGLRNTSGALIDTFYNFHYTQKHYFDNIDFTDSGFIRSPIFQSRLLKYFDVYTFPQPDSIIKSVDFVLKKAKANKEMYQYCLNELFLKYAKSEVMGYDAIYVYMADNYFLNGSAWWATEKSLTELRDRVDAIRPTLIGKIAPNFSVQDSLGKNYFIHDYIPKNKYTLLIFWNSDCSHCQHEIPKLKQIYTDSLKALGVHVMAVSTEQTDSSFRAFAAKNCATDWLTCADMRGVSAYRKEYDVIATPKVFLITKDFKIIAKNIPVEKIPDFIKFEDGIAAEKKE